MIKRIVCLACIAIGCLANAMSQEEIAEKVDMARKSLAQSNFKAVNVTEAEAPKEKW